MQHVWSITNLERNTKDGMVDKVFYNLHTTYSSQSAEIDDEIIYLRAQLRIVILLIMKI